MPIVLNGSTSGSITIDAPAVAGTPTLTLPTVTGTVLTTTSPKAGNVLQVVNASNTTQVATTSTSYVTTGLTASITPTSTTSKILVIVNVRPGIVASSQAVSYQLFRDASPVFQISTNSAYLNATGVAELHSSAGATYLDSPATTSSITYTVYFRTLNSGQSAFNNINNDTSSITLMEIAA